MTPYRPKKEEIKRKSSTQISEESKRGENECASPVPDDHRPTYKDSAPLQPPTHDSANGGAHEDTWWESRDTWIKWQEYYCGSGYGGGHACGQGYTSTAA